MEIEYSLNPDDFQAFERYHRRLRSTQIPLSASAVFGALAMSILVGVGLMFAAFFLNEEGFVTFCKGAFIGWLAGVFLQSWWQLCLQRSLHKAQCEDPRSDWAIHDIRVILSADGVRIISRASTSIYEWSRVWHIGTTDKHVFLCFTRNTATVVPRRVFRDEQHFEEFIARARQYQENWKQQQPKSTSIITALPPQADAITRSDVP